jgi:hypothetical protein
MEFPAKIYFNHIGMNHTSIDWNGKNGAIKQDCRDDLIQVMNQTFDIITNLGFSEHVGEQDSESNMKKNQYAFYRNCHNFGKVGTLYFHYTPRNFHWRKHGVVDYNREFFNELMRINNYEILLAPTYISTERYVGNFNMIVTSFTKVNDDQFMTFEEFEKLPTLRSKYDEYNNRTAVLTQTNEDGILSQLSLSVDVSTQSIEDEVLRFCAENVDINLQSKCIELMTNELKSQSIHGSNK